MKSSPGHGPLRSIRTKLIIILIALTGMIIIGLELTTLWNDSGSFQKQFSLNQQKQLRLLESELESEIRHLVQIFPAFVKSQELQAKIIEATLVGPYFVYSPQHYGQPIDYWDRVQILRRQIWMVNYFLPLLQSQHLDYLGVYLFDPHNNLLRNSLAPFVELRHQEVSFYSYPVKGLFHRLIKHIQTQLDSIALSDEYFDQVIYNISEKDTLYSALGFEALEIPSSPIPGNEFLNRSKLRIKKGDKGLVLENVITLEEEIYNWKSKKRESTSIVTLIAQKHLNSAYLEGIRDKFGSDEMVIATDSGDVIASLETFKEAPAKNEGYIDIDSHRFHFTGKDFQSDSLESDIRLFVLTRQDQVALNPSSDYRSVALTGIITILLGLMAWFYFKTNQRPGHQTKISESPGVDWSNPANGITLSNPKENQKEKYLLIEDKGKSQTIELKDVSHIRVTDHYCTIVYLQENQWKSWMIMERLKTFEVRYNRLLLKINRSTLINPERIDKIQLLQRKLTMQGEPDFLLTISQSSLEAVKAILNTASET